jgi:hypothetical protein
MLGFGPCYHMVNVLADLDESPRWRQAFEGNAPWDEIFSGFESTVDWPGSFHYRELIDVYPDAKVLLSVRDPESWAISMRETIWGVIYGDCLMRDMSMARTRVDDKWRDYIELVSEMWERSGLLGDVARADEEAMQRGFVAFNEEAQRNVPSDRLLVWQASDGWEPLCEFLGAEVPDAPFPRLNDASMFADRIVDGSLDVLQTWRAQKDAEVAAH